MVFLTAVRYDGVDAAVAIAFAYSQDRIFGALKRVVERGLSKAGLTLSCG
jgi:hypothetical protein